VIVFDFRMSFLQYIYFRVSLFDLKAILYYARLITFGSRMIISIDFRMRLYNLRENMERGSLPYSVAVLLDSRVITLRPQNDRLLLHGEPPNFYQFILFLQSIFTNVFFFFFKTTFRESPWNSE
jgi:hypothetical protein